jgi:hypothetical protein
MSRIEITRYGNRNWAVWLDGELLAVTVYRKGARANGTRFSSALGFLGVLKDP